MVRSSSLGRPCARLFERRATGDELRQNAVQSTLIMSTGITEASVLEALKNVRDPDLNRDIVSLKFIKNLRIDGGQVAFSIELTTPACPVKDQMRDQARALVSAIPGVTAVDIEMTAQVRADGVGGGREGGGPRRQEHHRGWRRQGWSRQDDGGGQSRDRVEPVRRPCGDDRWRHLWPQCADHARHQHAADDGRREDRAGRAVRHSARLDGLPDERRFAGHLARADAARRHPAVLPRGPLGRTSTI